MVIKNEAVPSFYMYLPKVSSPSHLLVKINDVGMHVHFMKFLCNSVDYVATSPMTAKSAQQTWLALAV